MPWKLSEDGNFVKDGENPVWVHPDGKETGFDAGTALAQINKVTGESMGRKTTIAELTEKLSVLGDIENPAEYLKSAKEALATVQNLKDKDLLAAGDVQKIKDGLETQIKAIKEAHAIEIDERDQKITSLDSKNKTNLIRSGFDSSSDFIKEKTFYPNVETAYVVLKDNFKTEENDKGELFSFAVNDAGEKIFSQINACVLATGPEAVELIINQRHDKAEILKGIDGGGGSQNPGGGPGGITKLEQLKTPADRSKFIADNGLEAFKKLEN